MNVQNVAAVVTGGAAGLGAATAAMLAARGARVAIFDLDVVAGQAHAKAIGGVFAPVDITDEKAVDAGFDAAELQHGVARVLVNCAGIAPLIRTVGRERPHPMDAFRHTLAVNLEGSFRTLSRFAQRLHKIEKDEDDDRGVVINTASVAAYDGQAGHAAYAASKAGIVGMTLPLARELSEFAIRVMTIAPGLFDTEMVEDKMRSKQTTPTATQVPHPKRLGKPDEFARLVVDIVSNPMLNGEVIRIDGALRLAY